LIQISIQRQVEDTPEIELQTAAQHYGGVVDVPVCLLNSINSNEILFFKS
jgi:hypothetical protein